MVKLLLVCLTALFGAYVEGMGPCNRDLDKVVKRHKVYPISRVANTTVCVDYVSRAEYDPSKYNALDVRFRPVIDDFVPVEINERKGEKILSTAKDLRVYQPDPTKTSTFVDYPKKGVNSTTVSVECVEGTGILVTHTCGYDNDGPTVFITSVRNKEVTHEILKECKKIADELAFRSVEFNRLDVNHCRNSR